MSIITSKNNVIYNTTMFKLQYNKHAQRLCPYKMSHYKIFLYSKS